MMMVVIHSYPYSHTCALQGIKNQTHTTQCKNVERNGRSYPDIIVACTERPLVLIKEKDRVVL